MLESEEVLFRCPKCNSPAIKRKEPKGEVLIDFCAEPEEIRRKAEIL
jgi:hypothetical protein